MREKQRRLFVKTINYLGDNQVTLDCLWRVKHVLLLCKLVDVDASDDATYIRLLVHKYIWSTYLLFSECDSIALLVHKINKLM